MFFRATNLDSKKITHNFINSSLCRRPAAFFTGFISSVAPVIAMLAEESSMLFVSRLVAGVGLGCATLLAPVYIAEIASPEKRGALIIVNEVS